MFWLPILKLKAYLKPVVQTLCKNWQRCLMHSWFCVQYVCTECLKWGLLPHNTGWTWCDLSFNAVLPAVQAAAVSLPLGILSLPVPGVPSHWRSEGPWTTSCYSPTVSTFFQLYTLSPTYSDISQQREPCHCNTLHQPHGICPVSTVHPLPPSDTSQKETHDNTINCSSLKVCPVSALHPLPSRDTSQKETHGYAINCSSLTRSALFQPYTPSHLLTHIYPLCHRDLLCVNPAPSPTNWQLPGQWPHHNSFTESAVHKPCTLSNQLLFSDNFQDSDHTTTASQDQLCINPALSYKLTTFTVQGQQPTPQQLHRVCSA